MKKKKIEKIKIYSLGNHTVGKTSFIIKLTQNYFHEEYAPTIGIEFQSKNMTLSNGKTYSIHFYDTAGQERYRSVALNIIKTCHGIILMYDITDQSSFDAIPEWIQDIRDNQKPDYPIILLGNKCDLEGKRIISKEDGEELAKKYKLSFFETSNKDGTNIEKAWLELTNKILQIKDKENNSLLNEFVIIENKTFTLEEIEEIKEIDNYALQRGRNKKKCS